MVVEPLPSNSCLAKMDSIPSTRTSAQNRLERQSVVLLRPRSEYTALKSASFKRLAKVRVTRVTMKLFYAKESMIL